MNGRWALVAAFLLAGCAGNSPAVDLPDGTDGEAKPVLGANSTVPAPTWRVGDVFEQHMYFGRDDKSGRHIQTVVVRADSSGYDVATTDGDAARFEAVYDYPILGRIGRDLQTSAFGSDWSWMYKFPLRDGATWSATIEDVINWNSFSFTDFDVTLTARFAPAVPTATGDRPGYWIDGTLADGQLLLRYNYVPEVGWFTHFSLYDLETPEDDIMFHAMSMGTSSNYTGNYLVAEARTVLEKEYFLVPDPSGPMYGDPVPERFSVPADARAMGVVVPIAVGGRSEVHLFEPDGRDHTYAYEQTGMNGRPFAVHFVDLPGKAGDWTWTNAAIGVASGSFTWISAVTTQEHELG